MRPGPQAPLSSSVLQGWAGSSFRQKQGRRKESAVGPEIGEGRSQGSSLPEKSRTAKTFETEAADLDREATAAHLYSGLVSNYKQILPVHGNVTHSRIRQDAAIFGSIAPEDVHGTGPEFAQRDTPQRRHRPRLAEIRLIRGGSRSLRGSIDRIHCRLRAQT